MAPQRGPADCSEPDGDGANSDSNDRNNASAVRFELDGVGESTPPATTPPATAPSNTGA